jgi:histidinol-phosphate/aromatic aminotransferase/cobyric acid decarboxylase-like protein
MGTNLGDRALRIAVKDKRTNQMVLETMEKVLCAALRS